MSEYFTILTYSVGSIFYVKMKYYLGTLLKVMGRRITLQPRCLCAYIERGVYHIERIKFWFELHGTYITFGNPYTHSMRSELLQEQLRYGSSCEVATFSSNKPAGLIPRSHPLCSVYIHIFTISCHHFLDHEICSGFSE